jgi:DNA-binding SARP family transcriptional activator/tetratricopeptide (TPR) repeat protein
MVVGPRYRYAMGRVSGLEVRLLGPLEVMMTGRPVVVDTRKALAIVALIAAEGRPFARDELAAMFWPEADDEAARGALRRTLSTLRSAAGAGGLVIDRARVSLDATSAWVDLVELERLAGSDRLADLVRAARLARGPFLAGFALRDSPAFDDWLAARAVRVERTVADVLDRLADALLAAGDVPGAIAAASRRVGADPLDEPGQRRLIDLLARSGDRAGAILQYRSLVAVFDRELGVAPLRETTDLYEAIRDGRGPTTVGTDAALESAPMDPGPSATVAVASSPLIGRDAETATLNEAWRSSRPDGRLVVIEGEAGIGKTRLGDALADVVRAAGGVVLSGRGFPGEGGIAYGPIAELLRSGLGRPSGPDRLAVLDPIARAEISRLTGLPTSFGVPDHPVLPRAGDRVRLLAAIADALTALTSGAAPGLVWVDDLHLADGPTQEALVYLARRPTDRPFTLAVAWRREDLTPTGVVTAAEFERVQGASVVTLGRLDRAAVAAIVRATGRPDVDERLIDAVARDAEGLPLHVIEALASADPAGASVVGGVHALLRERIGSVSETAGQVLAAAAVIGRTFDLATVRHASGRSDEETVDALEELSRRGIVREMPGLQEGAVRYDFSHGRLRDAALDATSLARRRLLHARTADALRLDLAGERRTMPPPYALIAAHERDAGRTAEAAEAFRAAADQAEAVYANQEAIDDLDAALAMDHPDPGALHARIGELEARLGAYATALDHLETAAALAGPEALPAVEVALGRVQRRRGDLVAAASHLDAALASAHLDPADRVRAEVERSVIALRAGDLTTATRMADLASAGAERSGDRAAAGAAQRLVGLVAYARGDRAVAREALERSVTLSADDLDPTAAVATTTALALVMAADGDVDAAVAQAESAIERCRRIGDRHLEAAVENHLADLLNDAGRRDASMEHLKRAVALFAEVGDGAPEREPGIWSLAAW